MNQLSDGSTAPEFALPDAEGKITRLADYPCQTVIVYFYPAAMTPGCTVQAIDFSASLDDFEKAGFEIIGISPDTTEALRTFISKKKLRITLLADPQRTTIDAYGVWGTKVLYGKEIAGLIRSTFIIDVDERGRGTVREAHYNVRATGHVERLRRELGIPAAAIS
ncbi:peroxiredoxin Q/BCP [Propionibacterium cyclohexanicum]|uniref:thioredoxin-dependent peroxiredoxin n=1 Tax=Propionibacterium cyclohexanicum TaxID=64702 RepID=A0A1H9QC04_9ACTN|nr:peroxiredoxin [Propionibacterium cyclohexanicum]SER57932.1 peroxiredoxin Q/BCP [Propionibacterium cyclohexanicum]